QVISNLNRITAENFMTVTANLAELEIDEGWKLELLARMIFDKAIQESCYCEIYSDMCMQLRRVLPDFEGDESSKSMTFTRALITKCQEEFEALPVDLNPFPEEREKANGDAQELAIIRSKKKERILGNMKFFGHLCLRQLLSVKVIKEVVSQLVFGSNEPEEHCIECVCILLQNIGSTWDRTERGRSLCTTFLGRLRELKSLNYPSRLKFMIQDLIDNRARGWKDRQGNPVDGRSNNALKVTIQGRKDSERQAKIEEAERKMDELAIKKRERKEAQESEVLEARKMTENLVNRGAEDPLEALLDMRLLRKMVLHNWYSQPSTDKTGQKAHEFAAGGAKGVLTANRSGDGDRELCRPESSVVSPSPSH
ncbi:hypothetical protein FOL47_001857, partial [Perkinsus chesapeaki]